MHCIRRSRSIRKRKNNIILLNAKSQIYKIKKMNNKNKKILEKFAIKTATIAGDRLYGEFRKKDASNRSTGKEIKTTYDNLSDGIIKKLIEKKFPTHSYLTEETGLVEKGLSDYLWIIDPLDGTSNFVNHNPFFSVSIALWYRGEPLVCVIYAPALKEMYTAIDGGGAYLHDFYRNKKIKAIVSNVNQLKRSYFVFCEGGENNGKRTAKIFSKIYPQSKEFRKIGSAAIELAWVGTGRADGYITTKISLWDIAAGILFVKEAGGKNIKFNNYKYKWDHFSVGNKFDLISTNGKVRPNLKNF